MKNLSGRLLLTVVYCFIVNVALLSSANAFASGDSIESIRAHYASINKNIKQYRKVEKELSGYSAEGGSLTAYFDGDSIKKIDAVFYGEMGRANEEYYFRNDKLIFVFRRESAYDSPLSGKVVSTKENRFYFDGGRMIRWLNEKGRQVPSSRDGYDEKQTEYFKSSQEFAVLARS